MAARRTITLRDGARVTLRPIAADDKPRPVCCVRRCDKPDFVSDADDAVEVGHVVVRRVALELNAHVALRRDPAAVDLTSIKSVGTSVSRIRIWSERDVADVCVLAAGVIEPPDLELVEDLVDAFDLAGILDGRSALAEQPTVPRNVTMPSSTETATSSGSGSRGSKTSASRMGLSVVAFVDSKRPCLIVTRWAQGWRRGLSVALGRPAIPAYYRSRSIDKQELRPPTEDAGRRAQRADVRA